MKNSQRWNLSLSFSICHDVSKPKSVKRYYTYFNTFCCFLPQFGNPISNGMEIEARDNILLCFWLVSKTHLKMQGRVEWYLRRVKWHWFYLALCSEGIIRYILCNFVFTQCLCRILVHFSFEKKWSIFMEWYCCKLHMSTVHSLAPVYSYSWEHCRPGTLPDYSGNQLGTSVNE